jgi:hypothetical protein
MVHLSFATGWRTWIHYTGANKRGRTRILLYGFTGPETSWNGICFMSGSLILLDFHSFHRVKPVDLMACSVLQNQIWGIAVHGPNMKRMCKFILTFNLSYFLSWSGVVGCGWILFFSQLNIRGRGSFVTYVCNYVDWTRGSVIGLWT